MMSINFYTHMNPILPILDEKISLKNGKNVDFGQSQNHAGANWSGGK
jgi:hypothetical protein